MMARMFYLPILLCFVFSEGIFAEKPLQTECVSRQEKWHSMRHDVRRGLQVFSCMQENT
jgi:hypothetical protein